MLPITYTIFASSNRKYKTDERNIKIKHIIIKSHQKIIKV